MKLLPDLPEMKKRRRTLLAAMLILSATLVTACAPVPSMPVVMAQATDDDAADDAESPHNMEIDGVAVDHATMHAQMVAESAEPPAATLPATPLTMPGNDAFGAIQEVTAMLLADPDTDWHQCEPRGVACTPCRHGEHDAARGCGRAEPDARRRPSRHRAAG